MLQKGCVRQDVVSSVGARTPRNGQSPKSAGRWAGTCAPAITALRQRINAAPHKPSIGTPKPQVKVFLLRRSIASAKVGNPPQTIDKSVGYNRRFRLRTPT